MQRGTFTTPTEMAAEDRRQQILERTMFNRPKLKEPNQADRIIRYILLAGVLITLYTVFFRIEYKWEDFSAETAFNIMTNFFRFDTVPMNKIIEMFFSLLNTIALGFITTFIGMIFGLAIGLFAAKNLVHGFIPNIIRGFASIIRSVPTIIWVLIVVAGYGLTSTTAIVGMFFHTLAFFIKSFAEAFEEIDEGTIEALQATGGTWLQVVFGAVLPSSLTKIISWFAIRSELNFAVAVIIGPAAGVPGTIGSIINNASRGGEYAVQGLGVMLVFLTAFLMESFINYYRQRSIIES